MNCAIAQIVRTGWDMIMKKRSKTFTLTLAAVLCAVGIIIPMFSPVKIMLPPASFTLASHVPIFIAMFLSPVVGGAVALGTTLGFLAGGFPFEIVLRALTHCIFAVVGGLVLQKKPELVKTRLPLLVFAILISLLHAVCEVAVVTPLYFAKEATGNYVYAVILLVGAGTVVHSMIDFALALIVWRGVNKKVKTA